MLEKKEKCKILENNKVVIALNAIISLCVSYYFVCFMKQTVKMSMIQNIFLLVYFLILTFGLLLYVYKKIGNRYLHLHFRVFVISIGILLCFGRQMMPKTYGDSRIEVRVLETKDAESMGKEVWLNAIIVDGVSQELAFLKEVTNSSWSLKNTALFSSYSLDAKSLVLSFQQVNSVELIFGKHAWSGMIEVDTNGIRSQYNLYDKAGGTLSIDVPIEYEGYSVIAKIILFASIGAMVYLIINIFFSCFVLCKEKKKENSEKEHFIKEVSTRYIGVDIIKTLAVLFVLSIHFLLNTKFYTEKLEGEMMFLQLVLRWLFYTCVPLFLLCTGFLQSEKHYNKKYWKALGSLLMSYFLISMACYVYRTLYLKESISLKQVIIKLFNCSLDGYAWYVGMFVGLYMLIPALNILYRNLITKKNKYNFIFLLCLLTILSVSGFFSNWWAAIYPATFYFIGAYINEFKPKIKKIKGLVLIAMLILGESIITYYLSQQKNGGVFYAGSIDSYGAILNLLVSVLLFLILYDIKKCNSFVSRIFKEFSMLTLEIYLFSYIYDLYFYSRFKEKYFVTQQEFGKYYFVIVPLVFLFSYMSACICAFVKDALRNICRKE